MSPELHYTITSIYHLCFSSKPLLVVKELFKAFRGYFQILGHNLVQLQFFPSEVSNYVSHGDNCILIRHMIRTIYYQYSLLICM